MKLKEFDIMLDIKKHNKIEYIEIVQGDFETNVLNIQLQDGLNDYSLEGTRVEIAFSKSDGTTVLQDEENGVAVVNAEEGKITCTLNTNTIASPGKVAAEVRVLSDIDDMLLTSTRFDFFVRKAIFGDDTIKSTNEWPLLKKLLEVSESEELRETEESIRQSNEEERIQNEQTREDNELNRNINEEQRIVKETERGVAESTRINSEDERIANEEIRRTNEQNRQSNELERIDNEDARQSNEETRKSNELERIDNEDARKQSESIRQTNEQNRIDLYNDLMNKVSTGYFDGKNLEFHWDGTKLGVRVEGDSEYIYVDLKGETGDIENLTIQHVINALGYTPIKSVNNMVADEAGNVELDIDTSEIENRIGNVEDDLDAHKADGASHSKTARFIIGTSTSGWTAADCDYLCDGTNDQEEIIQALNDLPATGGEVVILDGTYNITASINIPKDNVSIRGSGNATTLKRMYNSTNTDSGATAKGLISLNEKSGCKIQGLQIDGNKATYTANYNYGIYLYSSNSNTVIGNTCKNNSYGIYLSSSNSNTVIGNTCKNNSYGIYLYSLSSSSSVNTVTGNICKNNSYGIRLYSSNSNTVTGNTCIRGIGTPEDYTTDQHTILLSGTGNSYNLISSNNCMGKAPVVEGGTGNTVINNKWNATSDFEDLRTDVGDKTTLTTTDKTNLVAAINEVKAQNNTLDANKVDNSRVLTDVPSNAKFTDTITTINGKTGAIAKADIVALGIPAQDTVYTHPDKHAISEVDGLQTALNGKVNTSQVLTNVPAGAVFTDTVTTINGKTGAITKADIVALGIPASDTNTTYAEITTAEIDAGTSSTLRTITARRLKYLLDKIVALFPTKTSELTNDSGFLTSVTKSDVGLSNVDNVKQMPISGGVLENYREKLVTLSGTTTAINLNLGNVFTHTLSGNTTYSITNAVSGQAHSFTLIITQTETVRTITFPASVKWQGGEIPDLSGASKTYVLTFLSIDGGTTWFGMYGGEFGVS